MLHGSVEYELLLSLLNLLGILARTSHTALFQLDIIQTGKVSLHMFELDWTLNNNEIWDNVELKSTNWFINAFLKHVWCCAGGTFISNWRTVLVPAKSPSSWEFGSVLTKYRGSHLFLSSPSRLTILHILLRLMLALWMHAGLYLYRELNIWVEIYFKL